MTRPSGILLTPIVKSWVGVPRPFGASPFTNPISVVGHLVAPGAKVGLRLLGTTRLFGVLSRGGAVVGVGILTFDPGSCI